MDVVYWSTYDASSEQKTFYTILNAQIEIDVVGTVINLVFGIFDQKNNRWDWLRCDVPYDGDVNTVARYYTASDRYSEGTDTPNQIGVSD